jgi:hypothetical protein
MPEKTGNTVIEPFHDVSIARATGVHSLAGNYGEYDENGVDLSLIRYMLQRTPLERLVLMEQHARDTQVLLEYGRRHRQTKAGQNC